MDEGRDSQPDAAPRAPIVAAGTRLSPVQEAYGKWTRHRLECSTCRDVDAGRCDTAERLLHAYQEQGGRAYRRLNGGPVPGATLPPGQ